MSSVDLYRALGGRDGCRRLSEAFYARVQRDAILRPLFPGKSLRCAVDAFAAFLAQFLGGPPEDAEERWFLSLRESHLRFRVGQSERDAWMRNMAEALEDVPVDEPFRLALRGFFERSSAYLVNAGKPAPERREKPPVDPVDGELARRWAQHRALDDLVTAIRRPDAVRALELMRSPALQVRFARDRSVHSHALALLMGTRIDALLDYVERELLSDPPLAHARNRHGRTLLHDAAAQANLRFVELLLRLGAAPDAGAPAGRTPLYCVANERLTLGGDIVHALVEAGARVDLPVGVKRCTALHMAARRGNVEVARALLECAADIHARDSAGVTPLQRARNCRKSAVASLLLSRGAQV